MRLCAQLAADPDKCHIPGHPGCSVCKTQRAFSMRQGASTGEGTGQAFVPTIAEPGVKQAREVSSAVPDHVFASKPLLLRCRARL